MGHPKYPRGVGLPVSIHQGVTRGDPERVWGGVIDYFERELNTQWLEEPALLLVYYVRAAVVPILKGHEPQGQTEKTGARDRTADPMSSDPVPSSLYQG